MITIVSATMEHACAIDLRDGDAREIAALGFTKEEGLSISLARALWADAYLIDGDVAALLGFSQSSLLGGVGQPWLITGQPIDRHRKTFMSIARDRIIEMRARHGVLANWVHAEYREALAMMRWLGFSIGRPQPYGRLGQPFCLVTMGDTQ
jgi:hypothetical protein